MTRISPVAFLFVVGALWGLSIPLLRVAVSTGHQPLGMVLWQNVITAVILGGALWLRGRPFGLSRRNLGLFVVVAGFGAVLPGYFTFLTAAHLSSGVRSIVIAAVPMFVLPMALLLGLERPNGRRALGVAFGTVAIAVLALPGGGAAGTVGLLMLLLSLISPLSYAVEANYLALRGGRGLDPFQILFGASLVSIALSWPLAEMTGQMPRLDQGWGAAEGAVLAAGILNTLAYAGYIWLVGRAGSVFASQIAYLSTGFGVIWSMILLGERYGSLVWLALLLMLAGVTLVRPRHELPKKS